MDKDNTTEDEKRPEDAEILDLQNVTKSDRDDARLKKLAFRYDVDTLTEFINAVFGACTLTDEERILLFAPNAGSIPGYPRDCQAQLDLLRRASKPKRLYFSIATSKPLTNGQLRNRKDNFVRMYLLIADDIGTKVPIESIPDDMTPTYIIETSPGNYQYGYVFNAPVDDPILADNMTSAWFSSGYTDPGGAMITKLVRLPGGLHSAALFDDEFHRVNLVSMDGPYWDPEELMAIACPDVEWEKLKEPKTLKHLQRASQWSPITPQGMTANGIIDPVLEWMYDEGMVVQDANAEGFFMIKCLWARSHTDGQDYAYYSPIGYGGPEYSARRSYHCFHSHWTGKGLEDGKAPHTIHDVLTLIAMKGGPEAPVYDPAAELLCTHVFDSKNNGVWDISQPVYPTFVDIAAFKNEFANRLVYANAKKPDNKTSVASYFMADKRRVTVFGQYVQPKEDSRVVQNAQGQLCINAFNHPVHYQHAQYEQRDVDTFLEFINYLIPNESEREYFLDWLAAKYQDFSFRGAGILMVAENTYGTGRGTLAKIIREVVGHHNCVDYDFDTILESSYNEFELNAINVINEARESSSNPKSFFNTYERVKKLIDFMPNYTSINPKYGKKYDTHVFPSYLMFSNHTRAMSMAAGDRRIFVIRNPDRPRSPEYFQGVHAWLNEPDPASNLPAYIAPKRYAKSLGAWLKTRKVDLSVLNAPTAMTEEKRAVIEAGTPPMILAARYLVQLWPTKYLVKSDFLRVFIAVKVLISGHETPHFDRTVWGAAEEVSVKMFVNAGNRVVIGASRPRVRLIKERASDDELKQFHSEILSLETRKNIGLEIESTRSQLDSVIKEFKNVLFDNDIITTD